MNYTGLFMPIIYQTSPLYDISSGIPQSVDEDTPNNTNNRVKLPREELLKYTSEEYDEYIKRLSLKRPLSETEHKVARNQRRKIKNREYAQISRTNKKNQHSQLSTQIEHLNQQNTELIDRVHQLEAENKRLQEENRTLMNFYESSSINNLDQPLETYNPPSPPLCQSPPANTSSEESVDLFSEDITDNYSDWSAFSSKVPFTLFTVFCCLLLFYPFSGSSPTFPPEISEATVPIGATIIERVRPRINSYHRKLLNEKRRNQPYEGISPPIQNSTDTRTRPKLITIEDVLNEESKFIPISVTIQSLTKMEK